MQSEGEARGLLTNSPLSQQAGADPKIRIGAVDGENDDGRRRPLPKRPPLPNRRAKSRTEPEDNPVPLGRHEDGIHGNGIVCGRSLGAPLKLQYRVASVLRARSSFHSALPLSTPPVCSGTGQAIVPTKLNVRTLSAPVRARSSALGAVR